MKKLTRRKKRGIVLAVIIFAFVFALCLTLYPLIAEMYTEEHQSEVQSEYVASLKLVDEEDLSAYRAAAEEYNEMIAKQAEPFTNAALDEAEVGYEDLLDVTGTGIMGYVIIPKIDVDLPILHGTTADSLANGVGHMLGSSLPVGGESTHTVISGHSGLASAKIFSDLEQLEIGDTFYLKVLGETMQYEVDEINIVEPHDVSKITVEDGEDYCTLLTCTPFGVNTHRLLVRGHRVEYVPEVVEDAEAAETVAELETIQESVWDEQYKQGLVFGAVIALSLFILFFIVYTLLRVCRKLRKHKKGGRTIAEKKSEKKGGKYEQD